MPFRPINTQKEEPISAETQQSIPEQVVDTAVEQAQPKKSGFRVLNQPTPEETKVQRDTDLLNAFAQGLHESAPGELNKAIFGSVSSGQPQESGFWESVFRQGGELTGDAALMGIGALIGGGIGTLGGPVGVAVGGTAGAFALPAFLKEASRQYRKFQEGGGNLTFGEFISSADKVANRTLSEGAFGVILGGVKKSIGLLEKIPAVKQMFDTRYVGNLSRGATEIAAEVGTATGIPAVAEGRLPDKEDVARAAVLFTGGRAAHLPGQLSDLIKTGKPGKFNYALADRVQELDLAYPPLQEFKKGENPSYKNSVELDRNLTAFDASYINNIVSKINSLSPLEFMSADEAGRKMRESLKPPELPQEEARPKREPSTPEEKPVKPIKREVPLSQNPLLQAIEVISPHQVQSKAELGRRISKQYREGREREYAPLKERYTNQTEMIKGYTVVDESIPDEIQGFIDKFEPLAIPGSEAQLIVSNAKRMRDLFLQHDKDGEVAGFKEASLDKVVGNNRSIKQIPNWDVPPEMKDNLATLTQMVDGHIEGHLRNILPELADEYVNLNRDYAEFKNRWDNADMKIFYDRTVNNEKVANQFLKLDEFTQLSQAFSGNPEGDATLNLIRREAWRDKLGRDALNAKTQEQYFDATSRFEERDFADLMEYLSPDQRQDVQNAINHSDQIRRAEQLASQQYSQDAATYQNQMQQWKQREGLRRKQESEENKKEAQEIQNRKKTIQTKQDLLVSLLRENPAEIVGNMKTIEGIRRIKEATKSVQNGKELYDSLARYETENMFDFMKEGYIRSGRVPYDELKIQMRNKEFRAKLKELNGDKFVKDIDELVDLSDQLSKDYKKKTVQFRDDPTTLSTVLQIYSLLGLAQGNLITPLLAYTAKKNILKIGMKAQNMWTNKRYYDPEYIHKTINMARAAEKGNKAEIRRQAALLEAPYLIPVNKE